MKNEQRPSRLPKIGQRVRLKLKTTLPDLIPYNNKIVIINSLEGESFKIKGKMRHSILADEWLPMLNIQPFYDRL